MADERLKTPKPPKDKLRKPKEASKGQYGGLKSLGPGGGRDPDEATEIDRDDVEPARK